MDRSITQVYSNPYNDEIYENELACLTPKAITQVCLRYFEKQPLPVIPIVSCDTEEQLIECVSAFES